MTAAVSFAPVRARDNSIPPAKETTHVKLGEVHRQQKR